jgi:hypothetical protein
MNNVREYWKTVRVIAETLPEFVYLVEAVENKDVVVVTQVGADLAAKLIHAKTHRIATQDEVDAHQAGEVAANKNARLERLRRSGAAVVAVEDGDEAKPKRRSR